MKIDIPQYPRTPHLPFNYGGAMADDIIADSSAMELINNATRVLVQEKMDGANLRIYYNGVDNPIIGNREHLLKKGYLKDTPAKLQFRPTWNWAYENKETFRTLTKMLGTIPVVYGEWLYAQHSTKYDKLPSLFMAYDIYVDDNFIDPYKSIDLLLSAGFIVPQSFIGHSKEKLLSYVNMPSIYSSTDLIEGVYIKIGDGNKITHRFKLLRDDYRRIDDFTERGLVKNTIKSQ